MKQLLGEQGNSLRQLGHLAQESPTQQRAQAMTIFDARLVAFEALEPPCGAALLDACTRTC